ncbi:uncharacterized protein L969DRAFT_44701 [Mixia osmundae IAM 14324]|uniref:Uncharacterized protein n=1 Tax=Mixia osmundae (strain CBS 9802 / IAM 14324 / JCM 22182 / KY 12970) TaxID=764103 RepID=G7DTS7_MIXOS|nr:uncharacterized protein L969DRAFT_44701 [Mixia osmundae IAM 14324]KEI41702.1 hypothetical protein L969DRAFT_44701 [Mixia osmundae IAM 14324]GAA93987.1 hypothetical protein E5Q_00634 [Mixia osmundae IAM 14324]
MNPVQTTQGPQKSKPLGRVISGKRVQDVCKRAWAATQLDFGRTKLAKPLARCEFRQTIDYVETSQTFCRSRPVTNELGGVIY